LGLGEGGHLVFRVEGERAVLARTPDLLDLAGAVEAAQATRLLSQADQLPLPDFGKAIERVRTVRRVEP
jgi:hypothetical protein